jgi:hypothetical protein
MDLDAYRAESEDFAAAISAEYRRHFAGLSDELGIEEIYERHPDLFGRDAVDALREAAGATDPASDEGRRRRELLRFAVEGHLGQAVKDLDTELARRETELALDVGGERIGYRESAVVQANEADADRRAAIETARLALTEAELTPLAQEGLDRQHALVAALGWRSYAAMCADLGGIDLRALGTQAEALLAATEDGYTAALEAPFRRATGLTPAEARRSDLPRFFRFAEADERFPDDQLVPALHETLRGLGIDAGAQPNILLDVERRPRKSPRAFCAPVRVPEEVHLVVPPVGGRDDYVALLHEAGHAEHYAHVEPGLAFEFRRLGDNSVTEGFAFLFDHLVSDPGWLRARLGVEDEDGSIAAHARAEELVYQRRYTAKLRYELELHGEQSGPPEALAGRYAELLTRAVGVPWPRETFLVDVDPFFYAACYLRAWALEAALRAHLTGRFGDAWWAEPEAGALLRGLWAQGQRLPAEDLLGELGGGALELAALAAA